MCHVSFPSRVLLTSMDRVTLYYEVVLGGAVCKLSASFVVRSSTGKSFVPAV